MIAENHQKEVKKSANQTVGLYHYFGSKPLSWKQTFSYDGGGQLVAEYSTQLAETPQVSYLTTDYLGSPRVITNQLGAVTTRKDYMAFGEETYTTQRTSVINYDNQSETRKGYTGYEKDDESGLDFAQARYYNSKHGRFTSVDPSAESANLKNPQTFNRYSYTLNSPYKFTDPLGLISENAGSPCGTRCVNSGDVVDGSSFSGKDTTLTEIFDDMYITQNVKLALDQIKSGKWTPRGSVTSAEATTLTNALTHILKKGNEMARYIVSELVLGGIDFEFIPRAQIAGKASAQVQVTNVAGLNKAIQDDYGDGLSVTDSIQFMTMSIATEELTNSVSPTAALESNIVHEGSHALDYGLVINSATLGSSFDLTADETELRAKTNAIEFEHDRGDYYVKHGKAIGFINKKGAVDSQAIKNASTGINEPSILGKLNNLGVVWRK